MKTFHLFQLLWYQSSEHVYQYQLQELPVRGKFYSVNKNMAGRLKTPLETKKDKHERVAYLFMAMPTNSRMERFPLSSNLNGNNDPSSNLRFVFFIRTFSNLPHINTPIHTCTVHKQISILRRYQLKQMNKIN